MPTAPQRRVVFIDDEKPYNALMRQLLTDHFDCPVDAFLDPTTALAALPSLNPAVVVTDYFMPDLNGLELIRRATPLVPATAFVLISGNNLSAEQEAMDRLPALKGFLPKPFGWRTLADEILRVWPATCVRPSPTGGLSPNGKS
ncbi:response regulator [Horticoccus sp. 23ND18S-11]|uniref:response regulator n=1 Tax=Horticoccus sp. 23ND18S-11 TaxID=3391832 RepID=UPI0039C99E85